MKYINNIIPGCFKMSASNSDQRNIEIKARLYNEENFKEKVQISKILTNTEGQIIKQHDVFFSSQNGRLKLRYLQNKKSELIFYDRPDVSGPKLSTYNKIDTDDPETLETILSKSIGIKGIVKKNRLLFLYESTRIHLDHVENLGYFLEFEVCLKSDEKIEDGEKTAKKLLDSFRIKDEDLMTCSYFDELCNLQK